MDKAKDFEELFNNIKSAPKGKRLQILKSKLGEEVAKIKDLDLDVNDKQLRENLEKAFQKRLNESELDKTSGGGTTFTNFHTKVTSNYEDRDFKFKLAGGSSIGGSMKVVEKDKQIYHTGDEVETTSSVVKID